MHQPRLADLFEEFTKPHISTAGISSDSQHLSQSGATNQSANPTYGSSSPSNIPSFLPIEDIYLQQQYQPPNPEDEDDVVPHQHAVFGITRAMERRHEAVWRDLGLEALVNGQGHGGGGTVAGNAGATGTGGPGLGPGATLRGSGGGPASAASAAVRVRTAGRKMGGRRVITLR